MTALVQRCLEVLFLETPKTGTVLILLAEINDFLQIVGMKSNKATRYKQTNYRRDYVLDRIDSWCRF